VLVKTGGNQIEFARRTDKMTKKKTRVEIADPTIEQVFEAFLAEQRPRLKPRTYGKYESIIELLTHYLDGYGYEGLSKEQDAFFNKYYDSDGDDHREFSQLFGPEWILDSLSMFLGYYMVRKVIAGAEFKRDAGTVTKKLTKWLQENGYALQEEAERTAERCADATRDLPRAEKASGILSEAQAISFLEPPDVPSKDYIDINHNRIVKLEEGKLWFEIWGAKGETTVGPVLVPKEATALLREGWTVCCSLIRVRNKWRIGEMGNVYPD